MEISACDERTGISDYNGSCDDDEGIQQENAEGGEGELHLAWL